VGGVASWVRRGVAGGHIAYRLFTINKVKCLLVGRQPDKHFCLICQANEINIEVV